MMLSSSEEDGGRNLFVAMIGRGRPAIQSLRVLTGVPHVQRSRRSSLCCDANMNMTYRHRPHMSSLISRRTLSGRNS